MSDYTDYKENYSEENKSKKKLVTGIIILLAIVITVGLIAFMNIKKNKNNKFGGFGAFGGFGGPNASVTSVRTAIAEKIPLQDYVTTNGEVQTQSSIEVFPAMKGTVVEIDVSLGSQVQKGDLIGYIDPSEPGAYYAKSPIYAPISGSILTSPVRTGQTVSVSSVITKIGDVDNLQISAKIPERYVADLRIGQKAEITLEAYPSVKFGASVVRISPVVDSATRTKEIILNFDKKDSRVNAGMFAKVKLYTALYDGQIAIKQDALVNNSDKYYLFIVNDDGETVRRSEVTLGKNVDAVYQILSGVNPGDRVVVEGTLTLYDGAKIKDINSQE